MQWFRSKSYKLEFSDPNRTHFLKFILEQATKFQREYWYCSTFSIIALDGGGWLIPQPSCCILVKEVWYTLCKRLGGPQAWCSQVWKISLSLGCNPQTIQPIESCYNWLHSHSLWLFKEWIYLYASGCVIIQFVFFSATPHLFLFFIPAFTPCKRVFCFVCNASNNSDKVCAFLFLQYWPCGSGFTTFFQLHCASIKQQFYLSQIPWRLVAEWKNGFFVYCYINGHLFVLVLLLASTYNSEDTASNSKQQKLNTDDDVDWYFNQIPMVMFLNVTNLMLTYDK